jgi:hypothetical protein
MLGALDKGTVGEIPSEVSRSTFKNASEMVEGFIEGASN